MPSFRPVARQLERPLGRLLLAEVDEVILARLARRSGRPATCRSARGPPAGASPSTFRRNAIRAGLWPCSTPPLAHQRMSSRVLVRLAVADVRAGDRALPEAVDHLLGRQVAPALLDVALVLHLVEDDRLAVHVAVQHRPAEVRDGRAVLDARVRHPRLVVVVEQPAVVDRAQVVVRVGSAARSGRSGPSRLGSSPS